MANRKRRFQPPEGWTLDPKLKEEYEKHGKAFGRLYMWYPEKAIKAWRLLAGTLGPRYMLEVFRYYWIRENQEDYRRYKKTREVARDRAKRRAAEDARLGSCERKLPRKRRKPSDDS